MEKNTKQRVVNLGNVEDINAYMMGEYVSWGSRWVNFGVDNSYPSYLRSLYLTSPTHQAVVDGIINLSTGEGVEVVEPIKNPISNKWLNDNFSKDIVKKLLSDLKMFGYCTVEIYGGTLVKYVEAIKYRFDVKDNNGNINYMWFSNDWDNYNNYKRNAPVKIPIYREGSTDDVAVLFVQLDKKGYDYYAPVDYNAGINYISLENEISIFHLSAIKNGLSPSFMANFFGSEWSDEQMEIIEKNINKKWGGSTNAARAIINFATNKEDAATIDTIDQPDIDKLYSFLSKECTDKILLSHAVTSPLIFGVRDTGGGLGSNAQELEQSFYLYYEGKLKHYQNYILELIKIIMNGNLLYADVAFKTYNPFSTTKNTQTLSKFNSLNEIDSQIILSKIDKLKIIKNEKDILIDEKLSTNFSSDKLYKYVKASNNNNIINKKLEILTNQGFLFQYEKDIIENTADYYFLEQVYLKKKLKDEYIISKF